jgi:hypothetical protein
VTFYVNLTNGAVTAGQYDPVGSIGGWVTKIGESDSVQICFHYSGVPTLLPAGTPILFGCKALDAFNATTYLLDTAAFTAPASALSGFYTAPLPTANAALNLALGSTDNGQTAGNTPSIAQTSCEIDWWLNGTNNLPAKSLTFSVEIDNTPLRGNELAPGSTAGQAAALTALASFFLAGFFLFAPFSFDFRQRRNVLYAGIL